MEELDSIFFSLNESNNSVVVTPIESINYNSESSWDKNWIKTKIVIKAGAFTGYYMGEFMTHDFVSFKKELQNLYVNLNSSAGFNDLEGYLKIDIQGDGLGRLNVAYSASDKPGYGSTLTSHFSLDQTYIPSLIIQLDKIIELFPVIK